MTSRSSFPFGRIPSGDDERHSHGIYMIRSIHTLRARTRVRHLGNRAFEWLWAHERDFRISHHANRALVWEIKPLVELIFLLSTLKRHGIQNQILDRLAARAIDEASTFDWHELAAFDPSAATALALVADLFSSYGRPLPFDDRFFSMLNDIGYFEGMDRLPYREMDLAHSLGRMGFPDCEKSLPKWFSSTAFGREQQITRYTVDDVYSLTHAIFYLTDMGMRPLDRFLAPPEVARVKAVVSTLSAVMLRGDNVDVLGELILCWLFCRIESSRLNDLILKQALRRVLAFTTRNGAVAPTLKACQMSKSGEASFAQLYHTTLVGALLYSLLSQKYPYANQLVS